MPQRGSGRASVVGSILASLRCGVPASIRGFVKASIRCGLVVALACGALAPQSLAQTPGASQGWRRSGFPDGSGSIAMPPGWRLTSAARASAELQGPLGEAIATGVSLSIAPPQFAGPGILAGPYLPPAQAFAWVTQTLAQKGPYAARVTRVVESRPTAPLTQGGTAAYLLADVLVGGRPYRAFALVNTAPMGSGYWQYYMTLLMAPSAAFAYSLPIMTEIWQSWGISQAEMSRRFNEALATIGETNRIMQGAAEARRTPQRHNEMTQDVLRGYWVIEDQTTRQRRKVDMKEANALIYGEPGRYRMLSASER